MLQMLMKRRMWLEIRAAIDGTELGRPALQKPKILLRSVPRLISIKEMQIDWVELRQLFGIRELKADLRPFVTATGPKA